MASEYQILSAFKTWRDIAGTLKIEWNELPQMPAQVWHYLELMFSDPDWPKQPSRCSATGA